MIHLIITLNIAIKLVTIFTSIQQIIYYLYNIKEIKSDSVWYKYIDFEYYVKQNKYGFYKLIYCRNNRITKC